MQLDPSFEISNTHSSSTKYGVSASLQVGRVLMAGRTELSLGWQGVVYNTPGVTPLIIYSTYSRIRAIALDGSTFYGINATFDGNYRTRIVANGSTLEANLVKYGASNQSIIYRIYSGDGTNWGGTQVIYTTGTSFIHDIAVARPERIYYLAGTSFDSEKQFHSLYALTKSGTTWIQNIIDNRIFAWYTNTDANTDNQETSINAFGRDNGLDEVFIRSASFEEFDSASEHDSDIQRIVSNGYNCFETETFYKPELRETTDMVKVIMKPSEFGVSSSMKVLPIALEHETYLGAVPSEGNIVTGLESFASYSHRFGEWSGFASMSGATSGMFAGATPRFWHGLQVRSGSSFVYLSTYSDLGTTQLNISDYIMSINNDNNERISLTLGNQINA